MTIELEDNGQDVLKFHVDELGFVTKTEPFQTIIWKGAFIPIDESDFAVGKPLPIHHPPAINFGYLRHKVKSFT